MHSMWRCARRRHRNFSLCKRQLLHKCWMMGAKKDDHVSRILRELHWLPFIFCPNARCCFSPKVWDHLCRYLPSHLCTTLPWGGCSSDCSTSWRNSADKHPKDDLGGGPRIMEHPLPLEDHLALVPNICWDGAIFMGLLLDIVLPPWGFYCLESFVMILYWGFRYFNDVCISDISAVPRLEEILWPW